MKTVVRGRSIEQIIESQIQRWQATITQKAQEQEYIPVVTISREPGSGGKIIAQKLAETLDFDLFHQEIIHEMAESAQVSKLLLETLDEKRMTVLDEWIASLVDKRHLWPDQYLKHLMKIIGTIGKHGKAIVVGRGANFILPPENRLRVRIVSPKQKRIKSVATTFHVSTQEAEKHITRAESDRRSFVRKYFNSDIADPINYDLIINTGQVSIDSAVNIIKGALGK